VQVLREAIRVSGAFHKYVQESLRPDERPLGPNPVHPEERGVLLPLPHTLRRPAGPNPVHPEEARCCFAPSRRIEEGAASLRLAEAYLKARLVPPPRRNDARHIALATVADLDAIVSWNFRDMVNIRKKKIVHSVNAKFGYRLIDIISPLEVPRD
jgi:hypothetical protein